MEEQFEDEGVDEGANQGAFSDDVLELAPSMEEQAVSQQTMDDYDCQVTLLARPLTSFEQYINGFPGSQIATPAFYLTI